MPSNKYFNFYNSKVEQNLMESLFVESIKNFGFDGYIIPNDNDISRNLLLGEDPLKTFRSAFQIEMYLEDVDGYLGEQEYFSKFNLEIRNSVNVLVSKRSFSQVFPQDLADRPREGDLVYIPFSGASGQGELFEIRFVKANKDFFVLGRKSPYFYELQLEKFKYSQEMINTGVPEIDRASGEAYMIKLSLGTGSGNYNYKETVYQGNNIITATATAEVNNWNISNKELTITFITGDFATNTTVTGANSGASYVVTFFDPIEDNQNIDIYDNKIIMNESNTIIDTTETNPLGKI